MSADNRRRSARVLTEFPLTLFDEKGAMIDPHAVAHDVSGKGFKAESRVELRAGQLVDYRLSLAVDGIVSGRARIVWCQRTDLSYWAGAQFLDLSWSDRKRIKRMMNPDGLDWDALADRAIIALLVFLGTLVAWNLYQNPVWRHILPRLIPEAFAGVAMGMALRELLRRR